MEKQAIFDRDRGKRWGVSSTKWLPWLDKHVFIDNGDKERQVKSKNEFIWRRNFFMD